MSDVEVASVPKAPKVKKSVAAAAEGGDVAPPAVPEDLTAMFDLSKKKKAKKPKAKKEVRLWLVQLYLCMLCVVCGTNS